MLSAHFSVKNLQRRKIKKKLIQLSCLIYYIKYLLNAKNIAGTKNVSCWYSLTNHKILKVKHSTKIVNDGYSAYFASRKYT